MTLYQLRMRVRDILVEGGLWTTDEIIIRRRTQIWNAIATAIGNTRSGQVLVIGTATGDKAPGGNTKMKSIALNVSVPVTLFESVVVDPSAEDDAAATEDVRWQKTMLLLQGNTLGRPDHFDNEMQLQSFDEVESERYLIRQSVFRTRLLITTADTLPSPP